MKKLISLLLLIAFFLSGCGSLKKTATTVTKVNDSFKTELNKTVSLDIDTSKKVNSNIQIVEVEYFEPSKPDKPDKPGFKNDTLKSTFNPLQTFKNGDNVYIGNIKKVKTTTILKASENKALIKIDSVVSRKDNKQIKETAKTENKAVSGSVFWRWVCWLSFGLFAVVGVDLLVMPKLNPVSIPFKILNRIKSLFTK